MGNTVSYILNICVHPEIENNEPANSYIFADFDSSDDDDYYDSDEMDDIEKTIDCCHPDNTYDQFEICRQIVHHETPNTQADILSGPEMLLIDNIMIPCWRHSYYNKRLLVDIGSSECKKGTLCDFVNIYLETNIKHDKSLDDDFKKIHVIIGRTIDSTPDVCKHDGIIDINSTLIDNNVEIIGRYDGTTSDLFPVVAKL
jgi:hypothetical protein